MKSLRVTCDTQLRIPYTDLHELQGDLKEMTKERYAKFRALVLDKGIWFACHVWRDTSDQQAVVAGTAKMWIIDGHGRKKLFQTMADEGYDIPPIPCVEIQAASIKEAKEAVLAASSNFQRATGQGLYEFMETAGLTMDQVAGFDLPDIDLPKFKREFYDDAVEHSSLAERFVVPPFSILDARQGYWIERKRQWLQVIGETGESREGTLAMGSMKLKDNDVSILDPVLAEAMIRWFGLPGGSALDPFAGDTVFGWMAKRQGLDFLGIELRQEQADINQRRCDSLTGPGKARYVCDSSENLDAHVADGTQDFLFSCPPYYDLEIYSDLPNDLSNQKTYAGFLALIDGILATAVRKLRDNRFAVLVISEIRDKAGAYRAWVPHMVQMMATCGMVFYNELILATPIGNAQVRATNPMGNRKTARVHQNVLVFYKGDMKAIKTEFPRLQCDVQEPT